MNELKQIGKLGKAHGVKGELRIFVEERYEDVLFEADHVFLELRGQRLPYFVDAIRDAVHLLIKFEDVQSKEAASNLSNAPILLPQNLLKDIDEEEDMAAWIGFAIHDNEIGRIGEIVDLLEMKDQFLAEVNHKDKVVYIPLHEDLILAIEPDEKTITMNLPEGILDI